MSEKCLCDNKLDALTRACVGLRVLRQDCIALLKFLLALEESRSNEAGKIRVRKQRIEFGEPLPAETDGVDSRI